MGSVTVDFVVSDDKKEGTKEEEEEEEEEEAEYEPRWEINYDALYANEDEIIEDVDEPEVGEVVNDQQIEASTPFTGVKDENEANTVMENQMEEVKEEKKKKRRRKGMRRK